MAVIAQETSLAVAVYEMGNKAFVIKEINQAERIYVNRQHFELAKQINSIITASLPCIRF